MRARINADIQILDPGYMIGGTEIEVQRAVALYDLVRVSARSGAGETWALSLREYLRIVTSLRDEVKDPHVRGEFDRVLGERTPSND